MSRIFSRKVHKCIGIDKRRCFGLYASRILYYSLHNNNAQYCLMLRRTHFFLRPIQNWLLLLLLLLSIVDYHRHIDWPPNLFGIKPHKWMYVRARYTLMTRGNEIKMSIKSETCIIVCHRSWKNASRKSALFVSIFSGESSMIIAIIVKYRSQCE